VDLGRVRSVQLREKAACCCRGRPSSRCGVTGQPGVGHTVLMLPCRACFLFVKDKLLLSNGLLTDKLNCLSLVSWSPYIQIACCPVCSATGWWAELVGVACCV